MVAAYVQNDDSYRSLPFRRLFFTPLPRATRIAKVDGTIFYSRVIDRLKRFVIRGFPGLLPGPHSDAVGLKRGLCHRRLIASAPPPAPPRRGL